MKTNSQQSLVLAFVVALFAAGPTLSQSLYKAVVVRSDSIRSSSTGKVIGKVSSPRNVEGLANSIYPLIKPPGDPLPTITIPLGTISLINFSKSIKSKGVSVQFYELAPSTVFFKSSPIAISASSVRPGNKNYAIALGKSDYSATTEIPFRMFLGNDSVSMLKFDREKAFLEDWIEVFFYVDPGASRDQNTVMQLEKTLRKKDSRLKPIVYSPCADQPPQMQNACDQLQYIIRLSH
jgi:hypothetical protein